MDSFDRMFDFNRDGRLDITERAMQFEFLEEEERRIKGEQSSSLWDDDDDDFDFEED